MRGDGWQVLSRSEDPTITTVALDAPTFFLERMYIHPSTKVYTYAHLTTRSIFEWILSVPWSHLLAFIPNVVPIIAQYVAEDRLLVCAFAVGACCERDRAPRAYAHSVICTRGGATCACPREKIRKRYAPWGGDRAERPPRTLLLTSAGSPVQPEGTRRLRAFNFDSQEMRSALEHALPFPNCVIGPE